MEMSPGHRAIDKIYKRRDRYEIPDWQREEVWDDAKKRRLIDSILRGWKLPKFYFMRLSDDAEEYEVVDGQQRLTAIYEFFDDELELTRKSSEEFGAAYYSELPESVQDAFDDFEIEFDVIEDANEQEIKEFFQRLQAGLPLTSSEKLNSVHSNLRDFARKLAKHNFFRSRVRLADKRYAHFDIASKVAVIEIEGIDASLRFDDLKETFDSQGRFSPRSQVAARLTAGFDYLYDVFPDASPALRNRTIVQSFATLTMRLVSSGKAKSYEKTLRSFFENFVGELSRQVQLGSEATDHDYLEFQRTVNANVRSGARTRQQILLRRLLMFDPAATDLFDTSAVAESGMIAAIKNMSEQIADIVHNINSTYSSMNGRDLFKPTNKTARTLTRIGKPVTNYDQYSTLIDDLYFLFHESRGSRLEDADVPDSFRDVNALRTGLQHDLDHGGKKDIRAKMKKIGQTFKRYSGAPSPAGLDPTRFPVVQANLLSVLLQDCRDLESKLS